MMQPFDEALEKDTPKLLAWDVKLAANDGHQPFVWATQASTVTVWSEEERVLLAQGDTLAFTYDRTIARSDIKLVLGYVDEDYVDRGLKVRRADGGLTTVLFDLSTAASANPTYSRNEMLMDTEWIGIIGRAVAGWAGVAYRTQI